MKAIKCKVVWSWIGMRSFLQNDLVPPTPILLRAANEETFAEQEIIMFLKKFRNIFASREANFASAKNASKGRKRGNIC